MPPRKVMLVRHAEKIGDPSRDDLGGPNLSARGFARAAALPLLFAPAAHALACPVDLTGGAVQASYQATQLAGVPPRFETPEIVVATRDSSHSSRPRQTASPIVAALGCRFDATTYSHKPEGVSALAHDLLHHADFAGTIVLVVWHHGTIPDVAAGLGVSPRPDWPGDAVFDRVWTIAFGDTVEQTDAPQRLLFGDS